MVYTTTITQKGQVTIPVEIRKLFDLKQGGKVFIEALKDGKAITLTPKKSIFDLAGTYKPKKVENAVFIREKMAKSYKPR